MYISRQRQSHARHTKKQAARVENQRKARDEKRERRRLGLQRQRERREANARPPELSMAHRSADRYADRLAAFRAAFGEVGVWLHLAAWLCHNCIAHPLLGLAPTAWTVRLHDRTADWLNLRRDPLNSPMPAVRTTWSWVVHNCVAHPLIGFAPTERWFAFHDATAERLGVEGWV